MKHDNLKNTLFGIHPALLPCLLLGLITFAVYWQVINHEFIGFDDIYYVTENPQIKNGLTLKNISWSFTANVASNWHPLTLLSHMMDCQFYGLNSGLHHLTSLLFHIANTLLLFLVLRQMTMTLWRSAFVAALFAIHPLHVESVAWVAERKDMLSTFFWLLTMWAYARYVKGPGIGRYLPVLLFLVLGLMAKPMLVTLPFVLLLLDYWPLKRFQFGQSGNWRLLLEKIPLFILAAASCIITFHFQQTGGAVAPLDKLSFYFRITNAIVSYVDYIIKMFWPFKLSVFYPHPVSIPMRQVIGACLFILSMTFFAVKTVKQHPYIAVGWLWYIGTLVPVIGLVQVGSQAMADRYTYVPLIGIFIVLVWGGPDILTRWRVKDKGIAIAAITLLSVLAVTTFFQVRHWANSVTVFEHALQVTSNNATAHWNLGVVLGNQGKDVESISHLSKALEINPRFQEVHNNLAIALIRQGKVDEAIKHLYKAIELKPAAPEAYYNMGNALENQKKYDEAIQYYKYTLRVSPGYDKAYAAIGNMLFYQGKPDDANIYYRKALEIKPDSDDVHYNMGIALTSRKNFEEAIYHYSETLRINPAHEKACLNLGVILAGLGRYDEAVKHLSDTLHINPNNVNAHNNIGAILAKQGRLADAVSHFSNALSIDPDNLEAHLNMGDAMKMMKNTDKAIYHYSESIRINPNHLKAHTRLGMILATQGNTSEAVSHYTRALTVAPDDQEALNNLAWIYATSQNPEFRNGEKAVQLAKHACEITSHKNLIMLDTLAAAYAEGGQFKKARLTAQKAIDLAESAGQEKIVEDLRKRLALYTSGLPYYESIGK